MEKNKSNWVVCSIFSARRRGRIAREFVVLLSHLELTIGHSTLQQSLTYTRLNDNATRGAVEKIGDLGVVAK